MFITYASLTANPLKFEIADDTQTRLLWVSEVDWKQNPAAYSEYERSDPKFQVVLADSGTIAVLST